MGSLEEVNKVLGKMSVEDVEEVVGKLSEVSYFRVFDVGWEWLLMCE